jgi:hypothetical protein
MSSSVVADGARRNDGVQQLLFVRCEVSAFQIGIFLCKPLSFLSLLQRGGADVGDAEHAGRNCNANAVQNDFSQRTAVAAAAATHSFNHTRKMIFSLAVLLLAAAGERRLNRLKIN